LEPETKSLGENQGLKGFLKNLNQRYLKVSRILRIEKDFLEPGTKGFGENQGLKGLKGFLDRVKSEE